MSGNSESIVEKVGLAIFDVLNGRQSCACKECCRRAARSAIEAIREPTDKMKKMGSMATHPENVWFMMIAAALSEDANAGD